MTEARIEPRYDMRPGRALEMFTGEAVVRMDGLDVVGEVDVWFDWHAGLRVHARGKGLTEWVSPFPDIEVLLPDDRTVPVHSPSLTARHPIGSWELHGRAGNAIHGDASAPLQRVLFHASNYPRATFASRDLPFRTRALGEQWELTLDLVPDYQERVTVLRLDRGGAVTHAGALSRTDGSTFYWDDAQTVLEAVRFLLSFVSSRRVPTFFPIGLDADGGTVVEEWTDWKRDPFGGALGWCSDLLRGNAIQELWGPVLSRWQAVADRQLMRVALGLYLDAQQGRNLETRLVSAQAGLELMAWDWLTRRSPESDPPDVDKKPAPWRLRRLLKRAGIPTEVPRTLATVCQTWPGRDGPKVVCDLRNQVTHPKSLDALLRMPGEVKYGVLRLALWYLELTLLNYLGYTGNHLNKTGSLPLHEGRGEPVPWA